jgi:uncharacterized metal-binding protein YceD (DUF177 family)
MSNPLTIDLARLAEGPLERTARLAPESVSGTGSALRFAEAPTVSFTAQANLAGAVQVHGTVEVPIRLSCRRCLAESVRRFEIPLDFLLEPELEPGSEDEGVFPLPRGVDRVDIGPIVREELLLTVPEYPLCGNDCRGLCPRCGINLNTAECDCAVSEVDPRWEALRKLRV